MTFTLDLERNRWLDPGGSSSHSEPELYRVYRLIRLISEAQDWDVALDTALEQICQLMSWDWGEVWLPTVSGPFTLGTAYCHCPMAIAPSERRTGATVAERVWRSRQLEWLADPSDLKECRLSRTSHPGQIQTSCGVPVFAGNERVAVLVFFSWQIQESNPDGLELLQLIASQLGRVVQQKQAEAALRQLNQDLEARIESRTAALRESEERWQLALEASSAGIWDWDLRTRQIFRSRRWKAVRGYEEEVGTTLEAWESGIHPEDCDRVLAAFAAHIARKTPYFQEEYRILRKDGTYVWILDRGQGLWDESGNLLRLVGSEVDISPRKRAELALQKSEARYRAIVEDQPALICRFTPEGQLTFANGAYCRYFNLDPEQYNQLNFWDIVTSDSLVMMQAQLQRLTPENPTVTYEECDRLPDGTACWQIWTDRAIFDAQGAVGEYQSVGYDITHRKTIELALQEMSERLTLAMHSGAIGIWEWDILQDVLIWDDRLYELYGVERSAFVANRHHWLQMLHPEDRPLVENAVIQAMKGEKEFDEEFRVLWPKGQIRHIKASARLQRSETGCSERLIGISFDVTERKQAEQHLRRTNEQLDHTNRELERATRLKDEFLANMSHELRTPLNAILGMAEGLQEEVFGVVSERQSQAIATIERSGSHLLELINEILDLSKIEAGKLELDMGSVSVPSLCSTSMTFVRQAAQQKRIRLTTQVADDICMVRGDDRRLRQVLINLLINAVKFTPDGGQVCLKVWREDASAACETACLYFSVTDTGIGIALEDQHKLFQPFVQIDSSLNRQQSGTGLGLSLVQRIIELHGGHVSVESEVGQGSRFTVALPCRDECSSSDAGEDEGKMDAPSLRPDSPRIEGGSLQSRMQSAPRLEHTHVKTQESPLLLIVDDNQANIDSIFDYLKHQGYRLILARNGQDALETLKSQRPNLILMDIQMPGMDGLEVIRQLRVDDDYATVPVIALTALAMVDDRERCLAAGASDYLTKPVRLKHLAKTIHKLLHA